MLLTMIVFAALVHAPASELPELQRVVGRTPGIGWVENREAGQFCVITDDGTKFVIDTREKVQYVLHADGTKEVNAL